MMWWGRGIGLLGPICLFFQYCGMVASVFVGEAFSFGSVARLDLYLYRLCIVLLELSSSRA